MAFASTGAQACSSASRCLACSVIGRPFCSSAATTTRTLTPRCRPLPDEVRLRPVKGFFPALVVQLCPKLDYQGADGADDPAVHFFCVSWRQCSTDACVLRCMFVLRSFMMTSLPRPHLHEWLEQPALPNSFGHLFMRSRMCTHFFALAVLLAFCILPAIHQCTGGVGLDSDRRFFLACVGLSCRSSWRAVVHCTRLCRTVLNCLQMSCSLVVHRVASRLLRPVCVD